MSSPSQQGKVKPISVYSSLIQTWGRSDTQPLTDFAFYCNPIFPHTIDIYVPENVVFKKVFKYSIFYLLVVFLLIENNIVTKQDQSKNYQTASPYYNIHDSNFTAPLTSFLQSKKPQKDEDSVIHSIVEFLLVRSARSSDSQATSAQHDFKKFRRSQRNKQMIKNVTISFSTRMKQRTNSTASDGEKSIKQSETMPQKSQYIAQSYYAPAKIH